MLCTGSSSEARAQTAWSSAVPSLHIFVGRFSACMGILVIKMDNAANAMLKQSCKRGCKMYRRNTISVAFSQTTQRISISRQENSPFLYQRPAVETGNRPLRFPCISDISSPLVGATVTCQSNVLTNEKHVGFSSCRNAAILRRLRVSHILVRQATFVASHSIATKSTQAWSIRKGCTHRWIMSYICGGTSCLLNVGTEMLTECAG
jgi:hypothetical protein